MDHPSINKGKELFFDSNYVVTNLKAMAIKSGTITLVTQFIRYSLQLLSTIVLARLLTPRDYGLIAMVAVITSFIEMFKDLGLATSTIQKSDITHNQISNLFWINALVSLGVSLVLALTAPFIAHFYDEPLLTNITIALAASLFLSGLTVQHFAILRRQMRFLQIGIIQIVSMIISVIVAVTMAWYGMKYWALVGMTLSRQVFNILLSWYYCRWLPNLPTRKSGMWSMVRFGGHLSIAGISNYFSLNADNILIGRFIGADALGLYTKAYSIMMLPITQIRAPLNNVAIPTLSRISNNAERFLSYFIKFVNRLALITMPLMVFLFINSYQIIQLLLGQRWLSSIDIFSILCVNAFIQPVVGTTGLLLISLGQSKRYLIWHLINSIFLILSFIIGLNWGTIGVAYAFTIMSYLLIIPSLLYCFKESPVSIKAFLTGISQPFFASIIMGLIISIISPIIILASGIIFLLYSFTICLLVYIIVLLLLPGGFSYMRDISKEISILVKQI